VRIETDQRDKLKEGKLAVHDQNLDSLADIISDIRNNLSECPYHTGQSYKIESMRVNPICVDDSEILNIYRSLYLVNSLEFAHMWQSERQLRYWPLILLGVRRKRLGNWRLPL